MADNSKDLRDAINAFFNSQQQPKPQAGPQALPPGVDGSKLNAEQHAAVAEFWVGEVLKRAPSTWSEADREAVRAAAAKAALEGQ
jgi:hypothetical protein